MPHFMEGHLGIDKHIVFYFNVTRFPTTFVKNLDQ